MKKGLLKAKLYLDLRAKRRAYDDACEIEREAKIKNNPIIETTRIGGARIFQIEIPLERKITNSEFFAIL